MKRIYLTRISESEFEMIVSRLMEDEKNNKLFDENSFKILKMAALSNMPIEVDDEQAKALMELNWVTSVNDIDESHSKNAYQERQSDFMYQTNEAVQSEGSISEVAEEIIETLIREESMEVANTQRGMKNSKKPVENQKRIKAFAPTVEELSLGVDEEKYYLTSERVLECFKKRNKGKTWRTIGLMPNGEELQNEIRRAYEECESIEELVNPGFLDEKLGNSLLGQTIEMEELHVAALLDVYINYHLEKNKQDIQEVDEQVQNEQNSQVINEQDNLNEEDVENPVSSVVEIPTLLAEIPEVMKKAIKQDIGKMVMQRISDTMQSANSYQALRMLVPLEATLDDAIGKYLADINDPAQKNSIRAYIQTIRSDMTDEMRENFQEINVSLDLYNVNWHNPNNRKDVINMIKALQGNGRGADVKRLIGEINILFEINSLNDLRVADAACNDLSELSNQGIKVNIAFEIAAKELENIAIQRRLAQIVNKYDNVERDYSTELGANVGNSMTNRFAQNMLYANRRPTLGKAIGGIGAKQAAIMALTYSAVRMTEIVAEQVIDGPDRTRMMPTDGSGT